MGCGVHAATGRLHELPITQFNLTVADSDFDPFVGLKQGLPADLSRMGEIAERPLNLRSLLRRYTRAILAEVEQ